MGNSTYGNNRAEVASNTTHRGLSNNPHSLVKTDIGLGNVEDTALSTWAGSDQITEVGAVNAGTIAVNGNIKVGGSSANTQSKIQSSNTQGVSTIQVIGLNFGAGYGGLVMVRGLDQAADNRFGDIVHAGQNSVNLINAITIKGSPTDRTYTMSGNSLELAMASGTYDVLVTQIELVLNPN